MNNKSLTWTIWSRPFSREREFQKEKEFDEVTITTERTWKDSYEENEDGIDVDITPVIATSHGLIPCKLWREFSASFPIWIAHCNFPVSEKVKKAVMDVPGVIFFRPTTANEFRVAFGDMFDAKKVKFDIQKVLGAYPRLEGEDNPHNLRLPSELKARITNLIDETKEKGKLWAVLVLPNGEYDSFSVNTEEEFEKPYTIYQEIQEITGAIIYTSGVEN